VIVGYYIDSQSLPLFRRQSMGRAASHRLRAFRDFPYLREGFRRPGGSVWQFYLPNISIRKNALLVALSRLLPICCGSQILVVCDEGPAISGNGVITDVRCTIRRSGHRTNMGLSLNSEVRLPQFDPSLIPAQPATPKGSCLQQFMLRPHETERGHLSKQKTSVAYVCTEECLPCPATPLPTGLARKRRRKSPAFSVREVQLSKQESPDGLSDWLKGKMGRACQNLNPAMQETWGTTLTPS